MNTKATFELAKSFVGQEVAVAEVGLVDQAKADFEHLRTGDDHSCFFLFSKTKSEDF